MKKFSVKVTKKKTLAVDKEYKFVSYAAFEGTEYIIKFTSNGKFSLESKYIDFETPPGQEKVFICSEIEGKYTYDINSKILTLKYVSKSKKGKKKITEKMLAFFTKDNLYIPFIEPPAYEVILHSIYKKVGPNKFYTFRKKIVNGKEKKYEEWLTFKNRGKIIEIKRDGELVGNEKYYDCIMLIDCYGWFEKNYPEWKSFQATKRYSDRYTGPSMIKLNGNFIYSNGILLLAIKIDTYPEGGDFKVYRDKEIKREYEEKCLGMEGEGPY